ADRVVALLDERPTVVGGDFNSPAGTYPVRALSGRLQDTFALGGAGFGSTYPSGGALLRIDHLFASDHLRVRHCRVLDPGLSDHCAVLAELEWPESP
ncbi:MAG: endonuclease/exonuclease/phosphatase family protein, partial [Candidatus Eremiobacterota bacterium]